MQGKVFIFDVHGMLKKNVTVPAFWFGLNEIRNSDLPVKIFLKIMLKAAVKNYGFTPKEKIYSDRFYEQKMHIKLPFLPGAVNVVKELKSRGHLIRICSSVAFSEQVDNEYKDSLIESLGELSDVRFIPPKGSKYEYYKEVKCEFPGYKIIIVDDSPRHKESAELLGLTAYRSLGELISKEKIK